MPCPIEFNVVGCGLTGLSVALWMIAVGPPKWISTLVFVLTTRSGTAKAREALHGLCKKHPKSFVFLVVVLAAGFSLFCILDLGAIDVTRARPWLELINGATWPTDWETTRKEHPHWFNLGLVARTLLNLAPPLGVIATAIWALFGGLESYIMKFSKMELLKMYNVELVHELASALYEKHPNMGKDDLKLLESTASSFLDHWIHAEPNAKDLTSSEQVRSQNHYR